MNAKLRDKAKDVKIIGFNTEFKASGHVDVIDVDGSKRRLIECYKKLPSGRNARLKIDERDIEYMGDKS